MLHVEQEVYLREGGLGCVLVAIGMEEPMSPSTKKTAGIVAGLGLGYVGSAPDLFRVGAIGPALALLAALIVLYLIYIEIEAYRAAEGNVFGDQKDTYPFMCKVVQQESPAIFGVGMSYGQRDDVREVLRKQARGGNLTLMLPRMIPLAKELHALGATVHVFDEGGSWDPESRFTFVRHNRGDAKLYYGHDRGDKFVIEEFHAGEPAYCLARDLLKYIRLTTSAHT